MARVGRAFLLAGLVNQPFKIPPSLVIPKRSEESAISGGSPYALLQPALGGQQCALHLPQPPHAVTVKHRIATHNWNTFGLRLRNQHTVKRIFMRAGKESRAQGVVNRNRKTLETFLRENVAEIGGQVGGHIQLAQTDFGGNFPRRGRADHNRIAAQRD